MSSQARYVWVVAQGLRAQGFAVEVCLDDRACGGDRWRRSDGADVGRRVGAGGCRCRRRRSGRASRLDGSRAGGLHARTIEVLDQRGVAERFLVGGDRRCRSSGSPRSRWTSATFPPATTTGWRCGRADFEPILASWVDELGVPILRGVEVVGLHAGRLRRRCRAVRRHVAAGRVPGRVRRGAQPGPQGGGHRVRRAGTPRPAGSSPRSR